MTLGVSTTNKPEPLGGYLKKLRAEIIEKRGIDVSKLPTKEEIDRQTSINAQKWLVKQKQDFYSKQSLWPADIPMSFSFSNWKPDLQKQSKTAREVGKKAYLLAKQLIAGRMFNVVFVGAPGVGKTSLALAILNEMERVNKGVMFVSTAELAGLYQQKREYPDIAKKLSKIEAAMKYVDVLLLDDLGTEGFSAFNDYGVRTDMQHLMYRIANARFDFSNNRVRGITLVTTNNKQEQLKKMYDPKIISRLVPDPERELEHRIAFNDLKDVRGV